MENSLAKLNEDTKPTWGILTPQHMVEHLTLFTDMGIGKVEVKEILTPADKIERIQESLYTYQPMMKNFDHPILRKGKTEDLKHPDLATAKAELLASFQAYEDYYKEHPENTHPNPIFGELDKEMWNLINRKHVDHHFGQFGIR